MANNGVLSEYVFQSALDKKFAFQINPNLKYIFERVYGPLDKLRRFHVELTTNWIKPDVSVTYKGIRRYISLKSGSACQVHCEKIETVIQFLRDLGVSERTLKTIVLFQFGDGTLDGSGERRMDSNKTFQWLRTRIQEANCELNGNKEVVKAVMHRMLFDGVNPMAARAHYIYHGSIDSGILVSKSQVDKYIDKKNFDFLEHLHIGPLLLRPHARYADGRKIQNENYHKEMTFYWPNFRPDLEYIDKRFGL